MGKNSEGIIENKILRCTGRSIERSNELKRDKEED